MACPYLCAGEREMEAQKEKAAYKVGKYSFFFLYQHVKGAPAHLKCVT